MVYHERSEHCITVLYHAIENTVANTSNETYARRMMGRLDVIPSNVLAVFSMAWYYCKTNKPVSQSNA